MDNANQIMQGQTQGELNENGIRQAQEVSEAWKERPIDVVIASDLKRSIDTARIIAEPHGLEVITTPLLRERDWGGFTGRFIPDLKNEVWPDDIETLENLLSRAGEFIAFVKNTFPGKKVLAVGHGIINKAVQAVYYGKTMSEIQRMMNIDGLPCHHVLRENHHHENHLHHVRTNHRCENLRHVRMNLRCERTNRFRVNYHR